MSKRILAVWLALLCLLACAASAEGRPGNGQQALALSGTGYVLSIPGSWRAAAPDAGYQAAYQAASGEKVNVAVQARSLEEIWESAGNARDGFFGGFYWILFRDAGGHYACCTQLTASACVIVAFTRSDPSLDPVNSAILSSLSMAME